MQTFHNILHNSVLYTLTVLLSYQASVKTQQESIVGCSYLHISED